MNRINIDESEYYLATFKNGDLRNEIIKDIEFDSCTFVDCDLSQSTLEKCKFIDCSFEQYNLSLVKLDLSRFIDVSFINSKVIGIDWPKATWSNITPSSPICFRQCILNV